MALLDRFLPSKKLTEEEFEERRRLQERLAPGQPLPSVLQRKGVAPPPSSIEPGQEARRLRELEERLKAKAPAKVPSVLPKVPQVPPTPKEEAEKPAPPPVTFAPPTTDDFGRPLTPEGAPEAPMAPGEPHIAAEKAPEAPMAPERGITVGGRVLTPEQAAALSPEEREREDAIFKIKNLATQKGLGFDQAARELGLEKFAGEAGLLSPELGPLTEEQLRKRMEEENLTAFERSQKETQRKFEEQNRILQTETEKAKALARFQMGRAGTLFTSSAGGLQEGGKVDVQGPNTILRDIQDEHDQTLIKLNRARDAALVAARDAFDSGRFDIARTFIKDAQSAANDAAEQNARYQDQVSKTLENANKIRDLAIQDIQAVVESGQDTLFDDPDFVRQWSDQTGMSENVVRGLVTIGRNEVAARQAASVEESRKLELENAKTVVDIMEKIPIGERISVGERTYVGTKTSGIVTDGVEFDSDGRGTYYSVNKATGQITTQNLGYIGSSKDGFNLVFDGNGLPFNHNPKTGELYYAGSGQARYDLQIPDGTVGGQCGTFVREMTGLADPATGFFPNDLAGKTRLVDSSIGSSQKPPQVGDVIITAEGGWTGHTGIINNIVPAPDGNGFICTLTESNYNLDERVTNTRQIRSTSGVVRGFARPSPNQVSPVLRTGTDAPVFAAKIPKERIAEIVGRPLSPTQVTLLSEGNQLPFVLDPVDSIIEENKDLFSPRKGALLVSRFGKITAGLPGTEDVVRAQKIDDDLRRASQTIGRYMEGGVLRKEDEEKYRRMLPQLTDLPDVAKNKMEGVRQMLIQKQQQYVEDFRRGGFDVSGFQAAPPTTSLAGRYGSQIKEARNFGWSPELILQKLEMDDPTMQEKINAARSEGYTAEEILNSVG